MKISCYSKNQKLATPYLAGWKLGDVLLCCPGPSLSKVKESVNRPGLTVVAINTAYPKITPDIWIGMDVPECYNKSLVKESFIKIFRDCYSAVDFENGPLYDNFNTYFATVEEHPGGLIGMIDFDFPFVPWNKNTLAVAIHLLMWMGATNIYLAGCDMGGERDYWDDRVLSDQERGKNRLLYSQQIGFLSALNPLAKSIGVNIISATEGSPINEFLESVNLDELIQSFPAPGDERPEHVLRVRASKLDEVTQALYWTNNPVEENGVLVMVDKDQEWMLEWWWNHYSEHNNYPVHFIDIGMTQKAIDWCMSKGTVSSIRLSLKNWYKKPYALMQTVFNRTVYLDLDCQVNGSIAELFEFNQSFNVVEDVANQFSIGKHVVNTGVISYRYGNELITKWAQDINYNSNFQRSDQEILQIILDRETGYDWGLMPVRFNWVRLRGYNPSATIYHWTGPDGKESVKKQIAAYDLIAN